MDYLKEFAEDFSAITEIIVKPLEEKEFPHWKRLLIPTQLNSNDLQMISTFIKMRFSRVGNYSHLLPKLHVYNGTLCVTVDVKQLEETYKK